MAKDDTVLYARIVEFFLHGSFLYAIVTSPLEKKKSAQLPFPY